eukprot:c28329_g1_i1 orf=446-2065(-)
MHKKNPKLDPVLLVAGMGGSILEAVDQTGDAERVWVRVLCAEHEFRAKLWSLYNPTTGLTECIDSRIQIQVPSQNYGLYAISILDPSLIFEILHVDIVYYYHDMINKMLDWGYEAGTTLFGFGYDFRQSNRTSQVMSNLNAKLETAYKESGGRKVNIVTHSMGGLLVKSFLALHQQEFQKYVNKWIALACPFQGSPAYAYEGLLTGVEFLNGIENKLFISKTTIRQLFVECPSMYELLSSPEFKWENTPHLQVWREKHTARGEVYSELESYSGDNCITIMEEALENNTINYAGQIVSLPFNRAVLKCAQETQKILKSAKLPKGTKFYSIYGTSFETASDVCYGTETSPIRDLQDILELEPQCTYVDGDGTIPTESAMADELDAEARIGVPLTHRSIMSNDTVFQILGQWLQVDYFNQRSGLLSDYAFLSTEKPVRESYTQSCMNWDAVSEDSEDYNEVVNDVFVKMDADSEDYYETLEVDVTINIHAKRGREEDIKILTMKVDGKNTKETVLAFGNAIAATSMETIIPNLTLRNARREN